MADIQTVITGNVQQAQNILNNLLGQTGNYANALQSDNQPFFNHCLLYTSPSPRDRTRSRMPSSA